MIIKPPISSGSSTELLETKDTITTGQLLRKVTENSVTRAKALWGNESTCDFDSGNGYYWETKITKISTNKFIVVYVGNNGARGYARVLSVSGSTITYGDSVTLTTSSPDYLAITTIDADKAVVSFRESGTQISSIVLTVYGTTITMGTKAVLSVQGTYLASCKLNTDKAMLCFKNVDDTNKGHARVLTISGTTVTYGNPTVFMSSTVSYLSVSQINTDKAIVFFRSLNNNCTGVAMTVSGTTITAGSYNEFTSSTDDAITSIGFGTDKAIVCYRNASNSNYGTARVITVSGTTVNAGSSYVYKSVNCYLNTISVLNSTTCIVFFYNGDTSVNECAQLGISGTTITVGTIVSFGSSNTFLSSAQIDTDKAIVTSAYATNLARATTYQYNLATGYCSYGSFNSNLISGRSDNKTVVPYIALV